MLVGTLGLLAQMAIVPPAEAREDERAARDARSAQQRFERVRRANLPRKPGGGSPSQCDAIIGRFCYWYDSTESDAEREPEPQRIIQARMVLLAVLDSVARRSPEDPWITGQRVRYNIEAGRLDTALSVARGCRAEAWWCASLAGAVHHVSTQYVAADSAFAVALRDMPAEQRCKWLDISLIVEGRWRRAFRDSPCDAREELAAMAFTLGQPLWMVAGSDLRTEHFTRETMARVYDRSANAYGMSFGGDSRELLLRYGWPEWYTQHEVSAIASPSIAVTGHDREPTYYFFPAVPDVKNARPDEDSWRLRESHAPTRYAPRHIERMTRLPHQLGRFARGDSMLLVTRYRIADTVLERDRTEAAIAVLRDQGVHVVSRGREDSLSALVPNDPMIIGIEVLGDSSKHASRARYAIEPLPCSAWCLSDVLVIDAAKVGRTASLEEAVDAAYPDLRLPASAPVGVFFELTRTGSADSTARPATFTLTVTPIRVSVARRVAASLRLAARPEAVRMRWEGSVSGADEPEAHVIAVQFPPSARGRYRLQLTVMPRGASSVTTSRDLELVR